LKTISGLNSSITGLIGVRSVSTPTTRTSCLRFFNVETTSYSIFQSAASTSSGVAASGGTSRFSQSATMRSLGFFTA
jgi:hypothetical protein